MPKATTCYLDGRLIDVDEALRLRAQVNQRNAATLVFQCRECGERVRPHKTGTTGQQAHFEHREKNERCSLGS